MKNKYIVRLTEVERQRLEELIYKGKAATYRRTRAQILLWIDEGCLGLQLMDKEVAETVGANQSTVSRLCQRCVEEEKLLQGKFECEASITKKHFASIIRTPL